MSLRKASELTLSEADAQSVSSTLERVSTCVLQEVTFTTSNINALIVHHITQHNRRTRSGSLRSYYADRPSSLQPIPSCGKVRLSPSTVGCFFYHSICSRRHFPLSSHMTRKGSMLHCMSYQFRRTIFQDPHRMHNWIPSVLVRKYHLYSCCGVVCCIVLCCRFMFGKLTFHLNRSEYRWNKGRLLLAAIHAHFQRSIWIKAVCTSRSKHIPCCSLHRTSYRDVRHLA